MKHAITTILLRGDGTPSGTRGNRWLTNPIHLSEFT